jgi:tetratricopeptide (TPR) repeat protein
VLAVFAFYALQLLWDSYRQKREPARLFAGLALCGIGSLAAALVNPYGLEQLLLPLSLAQENEMLKDIVEFLPVYKTEYMLPYILLAAASILALFVQPKKRFVDWILFFVFGYMAFRYVRNVALFALVMYVPIARGAAYLADHSPRLKNLGIKRFLWPSAAVVIVYTLAAMVLSSAWGSGPRAGEYPEKSARIIKELHPPGRIFNFYDMGGYLEWVFDGEYQVSIDSRQLKMDRSLVLHDFVLSADVYWQRTLERYNVNTIVIPATLPYSGMLVPLVPVLAEHPGWVLAATDKKALLFFRRDLMPRLPAKYRLDKKQVWHQIIHEARTVIENHPDHPKAYLALGQAQLRMGKRKAAIEAYRRYVHLRPDDRTFVNLLKRLESGN